MFTMLSKVACHSILFIPCLSNIDKIVEMKLVELSNLLW